MKNRLFLLLFFYFGILSCSHATTYYAATNGSNSNLGTIASPWKTLNTAIAKLVAGDTLYVRGGIYVETISIWVSGTAALPINILAYPGELPIIDGQNTLPSAMWGVLLGSDGNYINLSGFEVRNTFMGNEAVGVMLSGHHNKVSKFNVHHTYNNGILIKGDYGIVEDSKVWQACYNNVNGNGGGWASGLSAARDNLNGITDNAIMRRDTIFNNWGEGFSTYEANGTIMEDNVIYDNWQVNVYISDAPNVVFQRNIVYNTQNSIVGKQGGGIWLADEVASKPRSDNNKLINNFILNGDISLFSWTIVPNSGLTNALFANNTCVNAAARTGNINSNNRIMNNIFTTSGTVSSTTGITWNNNLWQSIPPTNAIGSGDVTGDPLLSKAGSVLPGELTSNYFKIISGLSPATDKAVVLTEVPKDFFLFTRGTSPDIGGQEFNPTNIALNKTATASSQETTHTAAMGNDGNTSTRWSALASATNEWYKVDLGNAYNLTGAEITWEHSTWIYKYRIEVSTDNTNWVTALDKTANTFSGQVENVNFSSNAYRYIRVVVTDWGNGGYWTSINELKVFGAMNLALSKTSTASDNNSIANLGNDGSLATRWTATRGALNDWFKVDLGALYNISGVEMVWVHPTWIYKYKIEVSTDNINWAMALDKTANTYSGAVAIESLASNGYRYIRLTYTGWDNLGSDVGWASVYEFNIYGTSVPMGIISFKDNTTSIDVVNAPKVSIYPNPAKNILTIELSSIQNNEKVNIFNIMGSLVAEFDISTLIQHLNIEDLPKGAYVLRLNNLKQVMKFVK